MKIDLRAPAVELPEGSLAAARDRLRRALRQYPVRVVRLRLRVAVRAHCSVAVDFRDGTSLEGSVVDVDPASALARGVERAIAVADRASRVARVWRRA